MATAELVGRLLLVGVFLTAGVRKASNLAATRASLAEFGVPPRAAPPLTIAIAVAEIGVALALLPSVSARVAAAAAFALLIVFSVAVTANLAAGRRPPCPCFGPGVARVGWPTLGRNLALAAVAAFVAVRPSATTGADRSPLGNVDARDAAVLVVLAALVLVSAMGSAALFGLVRRVSRLQGRIANLEKLLGVAAGAPQGPEVGSPAPVFSLPDRTGQSITLDALLGSPPKPVLLVFFDPGCAACTELLPELVLWQEQQSDRVTIAVISAGRQNLPRGALAAPSVILFDEARRVLDAYGVASAPSGVLVRPDGLIGAPLSTGRDAIRDLMAAMAAEFSRA